MSGFSDFLRNGSGEFEWTRTMGAFCVVAINVSAIGFEIYELGWNHGHFDITAYCLACSGAAVALLGGTATAAGFKDRNVAQAAATCAQASQGTQP